MQTQSFARGTALRTPVQAKVCALQTLLAVLLSSLGSLSVSCAGLGAQSHIMTAWRCGVVQVARPQRRSVVVRADGFIGSSTNQASGLGE